MISARRYQRTSGWSTSCSASSRCASSHWFHDQLWIWRSSPVWWLCSSAEATDSWTCCISATAGVRNVWCVCHTRDQKVLLLRARLYRQMSDGGQQDHHCRLTVWGSAHWWIIDEDEGWLPSSFYSVHIDAYIMSECCRILHKPSVLNFRPLFSSLCICID